MRWSDAKQGPDELEPQRRGCCRDDRLRLPSLVCVRARPHVSSGRHFLRAVHWPPSSARGMLDGRARAARGVRWCGAAGAGTGRCGSCGSRHQRHSPNLLLGGVLSLSVEGRSGLPEAAATVALPDPIFAYESKSAAREVSVPCPSASKSRRPIRTVRRRSKVG